MFYTDFIVVYLANFIRFLEVHCLWKNVEILTKKKYLPRNIKLLKALTFSINRYK